MVTLMILFSLITVLMGTRMGLIMIAFGIGFLYISKTPKILVFGKRLIVSIVVLAIVYYAIMNVDVLYGSIGYRVETMISGFLGNETDASTDDRSFFALEALSVFKENLFIGIGQDGYRYVNSREFQHN